MGDFTHDPLSFHHAVVAEVFNGVGEGADFLQALHSVDHYWSRGGATLLNFIRLSVIRTHEVLIEELLI